MIIKVCGMKEAENIRQLAGLEVDYMGFIFYSGSKRFAGSLDKDALRSLPGSIKKTGVFVNEDIDIVLDKVISYQLDAVQLHGNESPEYCETLQKLFDRVKTERRVELIKAFGIFSGFDFADIQAYTGKVAYFLFDTKTTDHGGSGMAFDWSILKEYTSPTPYFLSGGLSPENISSISSITDERLYGVDLNSKFEIEPGIKDIGKLKLAFQLIQGQKIPH